MTHRANIDINGRTGTVEIDGHHVRGILSLDLRASGRGMPELVLTLRPGAIAANIDSAAVTVDEKTRGALVALGWLPPEQNKAIANLVTYYAELANELQPAGDDEQCEHADCHASGQAFATRRAANLIREAIKVPPAEVTG